MEHFYSDKDEIKRKTGSKLRELIKRGDGLLPTMVIGEIVRVTCERRGDRGGETPLHLTCKKRVENTQFR